MVHLKKINIKMKTFSVQITIMGQRFFVQGITAY